MFLSAAGISRKERIIFSKDKAFEGKKQHTNFTVKQLLRHLNREVK